MLWLGACSGQAVPAGQSETRILARYPHDTSAFVQGMLIHDGTLYESTGQYGASRLRRIAIETGTVRAEIRLSDQYFGEGLALIDDRLYWLTWKTGRAFVFDRRTLEPRGTRRYDGQGWGLTPLGERLVMSDGSDILSVLDPSNFSVIRRIPVRHAGRPVERLNELETIDGMIWANIWLEDRIVVIDPETGGVVHVIDARPLRDALVAPGPAEALNGIAWDSADRRLYLTGKNWPSLFEIALPEALRP